jgi:hypothetical protein
MAKLVAAVGYTVGLNGSGIVYEAEQGGINPGVFLVQRWLTSEGTEPFVYIWEGGVTDHVQRGKGQANLRSSYLQESKVYKKPDGTIDVENGNYPRLFEGTLPTVSQGGGNPVIPVTPGNGVIEIPVSFTGVLKIDLSTLSALIELS